MQHFILFLLLTLSLACNKVEDNKEPVVEPTKVTEVKVTGEENNYTFAVTLKTPDTGCDQYANWWEVIDTDGNLITRRILGHSHVDEQPFTRSKGGVNITANQEVIIRGHMNNTGYISSGFQGSVESGFNAVELEAGFAVVIESSEPQPGPCPF